MKVPQIIRCWKPHSCHRKPNQNPCRTLQIDAILPAFHLLLRTYLHFNGKIGGGWPLLAFIHIKIIQSQCGNESLISTWHLTFSIWTRCYCIIAFFLRTGLLDMIFLQLEQIFQFYWMLFCWDIFPYWHDVDWNSVLVQWQQVIVT